MLHAILAIAIASATAPASNTCFTGAPAETRIADCQSLIQAQVLTGPELARAYARLGGAYEELNQNEAARAALDQAVALAPHDTQALAYRATVYFKMNRMDEAIADLGGAIASDPKIAPLLVFRGTLYNLKSRYADAQADFDRALALDPDNALAYCGRGEAEGGLGRFDDAVADETRSIAIKADDAQCFVLRAMALGDKKQYFDAIRDDTQALRIAPDHWQALYQRSLMYQALGRYSDALGDATAAWRASDSDEVMLEIGEDWLYLHNLSTADAVFHGLAAKMPDNAQLFYDIGWTAFDRGDYAAAIAPLTKAIALDPKDAAAYSMRAAAYGRMDDKDRAIADYDVYLTMRPDDATAYQARCWARALANRELDKAKADCDKAVEIDSGYAEGYDTRGFLDLRMGRDQDAIRDFSLVLGIKPKASRALYGRGLARRHLGDEAGAAADTAAAKALDDQIDHFYARNLGGSTLDPAKK